MQIFGFVIAAAVAIAGVNAGASCDDGDDQTPAPTPNDVAFVYVGTYTRSEPWVPEGSGKGVHVLKMNLTDGSLTPSAIVSVGTNPTFITGTNDKNRPVLYVVNEANEPSKLKPGALTGRVVALAADPATGALTELNSMETGGNYTMHVSLNPSQDFVGVSNYFGGSVSLFPLEANGALKPASDFHQYTGGTHVFPIRQEASHMHSVNWVGGNSPAVFAPDLGNDRIVQYRFDAATGKLTSDPKTEFCTLPLGSGPRHMAIHPSKKFAYCVLELSNRVVGFLIDEATGTLSPTAMGGISSLPQDFHGESTAADIHISDDGTFLYVSNRGHDSILAYKIHADGSLESIGGAFTRGKTPRGFQLVGNWLVVANQDSDSVQVFNVDPSTGLLTYANQSATVGTPTGLFIPRY